MSSESSVSIQVRDHTDDRQATMRLIASRTIAQVRPRILERLALPLEEESGEAIWYSLFNDSDQAKPYLHDAKVVGDALTDGQTVRAIPEIVAGAPAVLTGVAPTGFYLVAKSADRCRPANVPNWVLAPLAEWLRWDGRCRGRISPEEWPAMAAYVGPSPGAPSEPTEIVVTLLGGQEPIRRPWRTGELQGLGVSMGRPVFTSFQAGMGTHKNKGFIGFFFDCLPGLVADRMKA